MDEDTTSWLLALELVWILLVAIRLVWERRSPTSTLAWIFALVFLPWIGAFVYFFFGPRRMRQRKMAHARARAGTIPLGKDGAVASSSLCVLAERTGGLPAMHGDGELLFDGAATYDAIVEAIEGARDHVHVEYYIFARGASAARLLDALVARARAGVEVRLLVDQVGSYGTPDRVFAPLVAAGGTVARFGHTALSRFKPRFTNFRTHRKIVVVDGRTGFTGGINVDDVHDERITGPKAWRDTHVRIVGDAVRGLQATFAQNWRYATDERLVGSRYFPPPNREGGSVVQIVPGAPDDVFALHKVFLAAIAGARERILLTTPYFVPDECLLEALTVASLRGVSVRVLVPRDCDNALVDAVMRTYFDELVPMGVIVHEYVPRMLHAKTMVVDEDVAIVGTANLDNRSLRLNFEVVALFHRGDVVRGLAERFERDCEDAVVVTRRDLAETPGVRRLWEATTRLFAPLL